MITYKIDKTSQTKVSSQIRDMAAVLQEIPNTLQVLIELFEDQRATISTPSIDQFRQALQQEVMQAIEKTRTIAEDAQRLANASEQASKHLSAIEEHFGAVLRNKSNADQQQTVQI